MKRAWVVGLAMLALALSCAGPVARRAVQEPTPRDEIQDLWMQIRQWRSDIGLKGVEPQYALIRAVSNVSMSDLRAQLARMCEQPVEPAKQCNDTCGIAEDICDNAERICDIADQLGNGSWEKQKCDSAKASCKDAKKRCCECEARHADDGDSGGAE